MAEFPTIDKCNPNGRQKQSIVADLDGTLLRGRSSFPYMALVAFETGGILRLSALVLLSPLAALLYHFISEAAGIQLLVFVSIAGVRLEELQAVSRAVLPKFYCEDLHSETWNVFSACGRKIVVTANPRILVEYFLKEHLSVDLVIGTEIGSFRGRATGLVRKPGVMVGSVKAQALVQAFGEENSPDVGVGDRVSDYPFLRLCKESYIVPAKAGVEAVSRNKLQKPVIFHDGRLVRAPTPFRALLIVLWMPIGFLLACIRVAAGALLPMNIVYFAFWFLGVKVFIRGNPPKSCRRHNAQGVLFICTHRTLLDPIFVSVALGRPVSAVTYSLSRLSEVISPIKTYRLTRDREKDSKLIKEILEHGDLVLCPEGTTCREPFLLRFSALFAELTDRIVPVAVNNNMGMFHGTTARGWKGMDSFYFFMNPCPSYQLTFLNQLPIDFTCSGGRPSHEVANYIQRVLAATLGYECTTLTRKDKYRVLVGNDGSVAS